MPDRIKDCSLDNKEDSLVSRLIEGEHTAAREFVDSYYQRIYLFMRRMGHDRQVSEDLTQDCFLQAWNHLGQIRHAQALKGWIYRIAANTSKQYWRRNKRKIVSLNDVQPPENLQLNNGERTSEYLEEISILKDAVSKLPLKLKQTIVLHYMQHLTIAESADALGIRQGTMKSRLNRALKALKELMA